MPWVPLEGEMGAVALRPGLPPGPGPIGALRRTSGSWGAWLTVFRPFRLLLASLDRLEDGVATLSAALREICAVQEAQGPATERLRALELSRELWEAECQGLLQKADGKLRAANNAEARERANKRSYQHLLDPFAEDGDEPETAARDASGDHDAPPSEAARLSALRLDVAPNPKALATRAKFGVK